jgi:hypothetical protein
VIGVGIVEEQGQLTIVELALQRLQLRLQLLGQLGILLGQLAELDQIAGAPLQLIPDGGLVPVLGGFARKLARPRRVVPDVRGG